MVTRYNVGELRRIVKESLESAKQEFKPKVYGSDETKKINDKAYAEMKKQAEDYNGGITSKGKKKDSSELSARNGKGMEALRYDTMNDPFKERVKSQIHGYTSKANEDSHKKGDLGNATTEGNEEIYKAMEKGAEASKKGKVDASAIGLTGRELPKKEYEKATDTMFESKRIKRLSFKNTRFMNEEHVKSRVPDELKVEGKRFIMRDSDNTEYLVEWHGDNTTVSKKLNMNLVNEQVERIKSLWEYKPYEHESHTDNRLRVEENKEFTSVLEKVRGLMN